MTPEARARQTIDALLMQVGWQVCSTGDINIHAARGVALREFSLHPGYGFADYLLYIDGKAAGVIEAKKEGTTPTGVEVQSARYAQGLPASLPAWVRPLPFSYESTGIETHFTQGLDPEPRARAVCAFHRPETLVAFLKDLHVSSVVHISPVTSATAYDAGKAAPALPVGTFDNIVTDEPHRIIYNLWSQVREYFDAYLIGLTGTPSKQTFRSSRTSSWNTVTSRLWLMV